jgi:hypothetical protein
MPGSFSAASAAPKWIRQKIQDAGITRPVELDIAPNSGSYPLVVMSWAGGGDNYFTGGDRYKTRTLWYVRSLSKGWSTDPAEALDAQVEAAILGSEIYEEMPGGFILQNVYRESPRPFTQTTPDGTVYRSIGGVFVVELY